MRALILAAALCASAATLAAPAFAQPAAAAAPAYSTAETTIGDLIDNPATRAVIDKLLPGVSTDPQVDQGRMMTFRQVQSYAPDKFSDETLAKVDAELAKLPAPKS
ncbi:hypothetical protein LJR225_000634 [Phenylobacterium sp. LjRoot225]|uniref:hypothetical protein n=1 Tax=Phenylobacterium sp. LjRoot225 TaxID=3342285 RepID=UPI003ED0A26B